MKMIPTVLFVVLASVSSASAEQVKVSNPVHPGSNLPILSFSNHDGVCRMLGFEKAVAASVIRSDKGPSAKSEMVFGLSVDTNGRVYGHDRMWAIAEITCMNADPAFIVPEESQDFLNPVHPQTGLPFAYLDRSVKARDQICQSLGSDRSTRGLDWPLVSNETKRGTLVHDTRDVQDIDAPTFSRIICVKVNPLAPIPPPPVIKETPVETPPAVEPEKKPETPPKKRREGEESEEEESEEEEEDVRPTGSRRPPVESEDDSSED